MYNEPDFEYMREERSEHAGSAPGSITCRRRGGDPVGRFSFDVFHNNRVVQTLQLDNYTKESELNGPYLDGLGMAIFQRLLDKYPGYEFRISGPLGNQRADGQNFIAAVRKGNPEKGREPLPYHDHGCFNPSDDCVCPLRGRQRS